jgi:hypothetical protein
LETNKKKLEKMSRKSRNWVRSCQNWNQPNLLKHALEHKEDQRDEKQPRPDDCDDEAPPKKKVKLDLNQKAADKKKNSR